MSASAEIVNLNEVREARELADMWQGRALRETVKTKLGLVICSAFCHAYQAEHLLILLQVVFPGFQEVKAPQLSSCGKIRKDGKIVADVAIEYGMTSLGQRYIKREEKGVVIFTSLEGMQSECRRLADKLKLRDDDRRQFFTVMRNWVVADTRLDPLMNPADPEAKRLVQ